MGWKRASVVGLLSLLGMAAGAGVAYASGTTRWSPDGAAPDTFWNGFAGIEGIGGLVDVHCHGWVTYRLFIAPNVDANPPDDWNPCMVAMTTHDWSNVPRAPSR